MAQENELPPIMANAREDLAGSLGGDFSPGDWDKILAQAHEKLSLSEKPPQEAWVDVIRDFHSQRYWGFTPDYVKPKPKPEDKVLGKRFIWYCFRSFLITKVVVLYFGARWSADQEPINGYIFFGAMIFMITSYGLFIWRYSRGRKD
ncbi:MAG: hypothetical protein KF799_09560 [Bdellovibrionales bacterium]|nr:hypothetical protein [Bdellovibrionales bacterium]